MRVPPTIGGDWRSWAQALSRVLEASNGQLDAKNANSSAAVDGVLMWDRTNEVPVVSRDGAFVTISTQVAAPATAASTGKAGDWAYDASYIYVCTATNTWKRAAIATW